jgi:hypothetical protein
MHKIQHKSIDKVFRLRYIDYSSLTTQPILRTTYDGRVNPGKRYPPYFLTRVHPTIAMSATLKIHKIVKRLRNHITLERSSIIT